MLLSIARFEFRYLLRNPLLWVTFLVSFLLLFISMNIKGFELGSGGILLENSSFATLRNYLVISVLFMFVTTSFVADAVIRDDKTGFGSILRSTRITKFEYLTGRFLGAFAIAALCLLIVPLAIYVGTLMPWAEPGSLGPNRISDHLYGYFLIGLPNIFISSAIFFALATITRSMMASYLGVIILTSAFFMLQGAFQGSPQIAIAISIAEPFGGRALNEITRYWTVAERNTELPEFSGILLYNRLLWMSISLFFLWLTYVTYRFAQRGISARKLKKQNSSLKTFTETPLVLKNINLPSPQQGFAPKLALLWMRIKFEIRQVIISPAFLILMIWGVVSTFMVLLTQRDPDGRATHPTTLSLIPELQGAFDVILLIIAIYYAGELVWRERDRKFHEIIDAAPIPNWAYVVPKTLAMALVLILTLLITVIASVIVQIWLGHTNIEPEKYLLWYVLPMAWDMLLLAALAIFVQSLSPNKAVGWGIMVLILIGQQMNTAVDHNLLLYGESSYMPLSDMNSAGSFWIGAWTFRIYWGAFAVLLLVIAHLLWRRGTDVHLKPRLARSPRRLAGTTGWVAGIALLVFIMTGAFAYYNTNVLNNYESQSVLPGKMAEFEKKYAKYHGLPQPTITHVRLDITLFPEERRAVTNGSYILTNHTGEPIKDIHVVLYDRDLELAHIALEGGRLILNDSIHNYQIYRLNVPLPPGGKRILAFETQRWHRGFRNDFPNTKMVENGTFLTNTEFMPLIGMSYNGILEDPSLRRKYNLPEKLPVPEFDDLSARNKPAVGGGWATADITVSTIEDQTPIAPGKKVYDITKKGRRTARFVLDTPILTTFSIQSARYEEKHRKHNGIDLSIFYHPEHSWNVNRMFDALVASLDYYQKNFGPYQFDFMRIVEFPGYGSYAQAFAGTIPYSEASGFAADFTVPETIDYVTFTTSHELAHQYWPHQAVGAALPGAAMLSETLAQYAALMVAKKMQGEYKIQRPLKYELDRYLRGRTYSSSPEPPLARVINESHVTYHKGALAMYLLQKRMGEDAVNRALRSYLEKYKFEGPPYPRSVDLISAFRAEAKSAEMQDLITDLFEKVTLYDLKVIKPTARLRRDGKWDVTIPIVAGKFYTDDNGNEAETPLAESIEIGLFTAQPGIDNFKRSDVILMERYPLKAGQQVLRIVSEKKPVYAGVDPYNFYIDRNSSDNIAIVEEESL